MTSQLQPGVPTKPQPRFSRDAWEKAHNNLVGTSNSQQDKSSQLRNEARYMRNELDTLTRWDNADTTTRLAVRGGELQGWRQELERLADLLDREIDDLHASKERLEDAFESRALPLDAARECLTIRDQRQGVDLTDDDVESELRNEVDLIEKSKTQLQAQIDSTFEQISRLRECRQQITSDLRDKNIALTIDLEQTALTEHSEGLSYKPDPTRIQKGIVSPDQWEQTSRANRERALEQLSHSQQLRDSTQDLLKQQDNDIKAQQTATDYALRRRAHELDQAKKELEYQRKKLQEELDDCEADILEIERAIQAKVNPLKLAQTRLENRTSRPNMELVKDAAMDGLIREVRQLEETIKNLKEKHTQLCGDHNELQAQLAGVERDLDRKLKALDMERQCQKVREKLQERPTNETVRNLVLTGRLPARDTLNTKPQLLYTLDKGLDMFNVKTPISSRWSFAAMRAPPPRGEHANVYISMS